MQNRAKVDDALQRKFYSLVKEPMHFAKLPFARHYNSLSDYINVYENLFNQLNATSANLIQFFG